MRSIAEVSVVLALACTLAPAALAGEPVAVAATNASGAPVTLALVGAAGRDGVLYAVVSGAAFPGPRVPEAGDTVYAYAPGYDLGSVTYEGTSPVRFRLQPAEATLDVRLVAGAGVALPSIRARALTYLDVNRGEGVEPFRHVIVTTLGPDGGAVSVPSGVSTNAFFEPVGDTWVWPLVCGGGMGTALVHVEALADIPWNTSARTHGALVSLDPREPPIDVPEAVDGILMMTATSRVTLDSVGDTQAVIRRVPAVSAHVYARFEKGVGYGHARRGVAAGPLAPSSRTVKEAPLVDGRPAAAGSVLIPGRVDLRTALLLAREGVEPGFARPVAAPWAPVTLPASDVVTLWEPGKGIAYLTADPAGRFVGTREPGEIRLVVTNGFRGHALVDATWPGSGSVMTGSFDERPHYRRSIDVDGTSSIGGLPEGTYSVRLLASDASPNVVDASQIRTVRVVAGAPTTVDVD